MSVKRDYLNNKSRKEEVQAIYPKVMKLVEGGMGIKEAIRKVDMPIRTFYINLSEDQKHMLRMAKIANSKLGSGAGWYQKTIHKLTEYLKDEEE